MLFYIMLGLFFIAIGLAVHVLKWHFLISGYNTMPEEKKANVDTEGLGRLIGIYSYANGAVLIVLGVLDGLGLKPPILLSLVFFSISTVYLLIKAQKYDGNIYDKSGQLREGAWKQIVLPVSIVIASIIFVFVLLFFSSQETKVTVIDDGIQIHGMYGDMYAWDSIKAVELVEELPTIERKTNGSALGSNLKGYFKTKELGSVKLFVDSQKSPFIYLETDDRIVIFNMGDEDETQKIFGEILRKIK